MMILQTLLIVISPLVFLWADSRVKLVHILGPVVMCYLFGFLIGNLSFLNFDSKITNTIIEAAVPLSIPLLLFSTDFIKWLKLAKSTVASFVFLIISVLVSTIAAAYLFKAHIPQIWKVAGMVVGVYTGGTANMSAIGFALGVEEEVFLVMNTSDMIIGGAYFFLALSVLPKILAKFLPKFIITEGQVIEDSDLAVDDFKIDQLISYLKMFALSALILGCSIGLSLLFFKVMSAGFIILAITSLAIIASLNKKIRDYKCSYNIGNYLLLIFCTGIGSMAQIEKLSGASLNYFAIVLFVIIVSTMIHLALAYFFKIDRDTTLITSVAGIFGPAFIGPVAGAIKNKEVLVSGITCALVGIALGNYLGIGLSKLLEYLMN